MYPTLTRSEPIFSRTNRIYQHTNKSDYHTKNNICFLCDTRVLLCDNRARFMCDNMIIFSFSSQIFILSLLKMWPKFVVIWKYLWVKKWEGTEYLIKVKNCFDSRHTNSFIITMYYLLNLFIYPRQLWGQWIPTCTEREKKNPPKPILLYHTW